MKSKSSVAGWMGLSAFAFLAGACNSPGGNAVAPLPQPAPTTPPAQTTPGIPVPGGTPTPSPTPSATSTSAPADPLVCNPLGGEAKHPLAGHGLSAKLWYAPGDFDDFKDVDDFETWGYEAGIPMYFDRLDVPTRLFKDGFKARDGSIFTTIHGDKLIDNFAIRFEGRIQLAPGQKSGRYQFAIISDDGAVVRVGRKEHGHTDDDGDGDDWIVAVNNDGHHASRLGCAHHAIHFDKDTRRALRIDYFQGMRYHMAAVLLWRRVGDWDFCPHDPACGREGNDEFFDASQVPSKPEPTWLQMLERGWQVVGNENLLLPEGSYTNPCVAPAPSPTPSPSPTPTPDPSPSPSPFPTIVP